MAGFDEHKSRPWLFPPPEFKAHPSMVVGCDQTTGVHGMPANEGDLSAVGIGAASTVKCCSWNKMVLKNVE